MAKAATETKYRLTQSQLRGLTVEQRPALNEEGKTVLVKNPGKKPYRFSDGSAGAPKGFNIYVGPMGAFYEVRTRIGKKVRAQTEDEAGTPEGEADAPVEVEKGNSVRVQARKRAGSSAVRISLGSVQELSLTMAHELAAEYRATIRQTGEDPRHLIRVAEEAREARLTTLGEAMKEYIDSLSSLVARGKGKESGVFGAQDSLARLERPEVGLAKLAIVDIKDGTVLEGWDNLRHSAMQRSNRLPKEVKAKLLRHGKWWELDRAALVSKLRLSGKSVELAFAAGMAAAEHTMSDARRAVNLVLRAELKSAAQADRKPVLIHNPFDVLVEKKIFRSTRELRKHYDAARVRNPLGVDDAVTGQKSLPTVLKALLGRRDMRNGMNATAIDYILLTLLWGTRRNEGARLRRYDSCTKDELDLQLVSWVWIAPKPTSKNPTTGLRGSQVFLHDTKSGEIQLRPVAYFAERILRWREDARKQSEVALAKEIERAKKAASQVRSLTMDIVKRARAEAIVERAQWRLDSVQRWVFPARNPKAKEGHYSDAKSLLATVRMDAGLLDLSKEIDIGLTPHDLRRTLGRFAGKLLSGHVVSQLLKHHKPKDGTEMAKVSERYSEQEWPDLREAMSKVEEAMIATSPRAWNIIKGSDKPRLDERGDPEINVPLYRARNGRSQTKPGKRQSRTRKA